MGRVLVLILQRGHVDALRGDSAQHPLQEGLCHQASSDYSSTGMKVTQLWEKPTQLIYTVRMEEVVGGGEEVCVLCQACNSLPMALC